MKIIQKILYTSIYMKLVFAFLLVITPLYSLSLLMNKWGEKIIVEDISESMSSKVHFYLSSLDDEFNRIISLQHSFLTDRDIIELSLINEHMSDIEKSDAIHRVYRKMQIINNTSNYIENANANIIEIDRTISSSVITSTIDHEKMSALADQSFLPLSVFNNRLIISALYPSIYSFGIEKDPSFVLDIEISEAAIEHVLSQFSTQNYGNAMFYHNEGKHTIYESAEGRQLHAAIEEMLNNKLKAEIDRDLDTVEVNGEKYLITFEKSSVVDYSLVMFVPEQKLFQQLHEFTRWFWIISAVSFIIVIFFSYWIYRLIHRPLRKLVDAFQLVENGDLSVSIKDNRKDEFNYLYVQFNSMILKLKSLIREVYEQKYRVQRSELKHLQSQVNPHFLYNSFFILNQMVKKQDYENLLPFSKNLADYFRFINRDGRDELPLVLEVSYAKSYLNIQSFRFSNRIEVYFEELPKECNSILVPRLILQPIIQNAFDHGMKNTVSEGKINIIFNLVEGTLVIIVEDNGIGMADTELTHLQNLLKQPENALESTGLINIHHRLQLKFGTNSKVIIERSNIGGLLVKLFIPVGGEQRDESTINHR